MNVVDVTGLEKAYGSRTILGGITFALAEGEKAGVLGRNGCGKSTLLRIMGGQEEADAGTILRKRGMSCVYLAQETSLEADLTVRETLDRCLVDTRRHLTRYHAINAMLPKEAPEDADRLLAEQETIQGWLDLHRAWNLDHRIDEICGHLAIVDLDQRVGSLSGGQAKRVALAGVLLEEPDLLLLDEPTNHLDAETVAWLEQELKTYPGAVLLVTHDRYFLDRVASRMLEIDEGGLTVYKGGYTAYLEQKRERMEIEGKAQSRLANLLRREEEWLRRGAKARTTKQKARIDRVDKLQQQKKTVGDRGVVLDFTPSSRLGGTVLELQHLRVAAGELTLINDLSLILRRGERIGIFGPNGTGKSSLLRVILGDMAPVSGKVVIGQKSRIGYIDQQRSGLDPSQFVHEALGVGDWVTVGGQKKHKIGYLENFLFTREEQRKRISTLSGGERARLLLAKLMLEGANLLILDEPTNDLDIPTLQMLDEALATFAGSLLVVTHDRYFLDRVVTGILHFEGEGKVVFFEGNYEMFTRLRQDQERQQRLQQKQVEAPSKSRNDSRPKKRAGLSFKEKRELEQVEAEIDELEGEKAELEQTLADPSAIEGGPDALSELGRRFAEAETRLAELYQRWEELELKKSGE